MYPFVRMAIEMALHRRAPPLAPGDVHVSRHTCMPWDIDLWAELNNGRVLTLYDLGRIPLAHRMGMLGVLRTNGWGVAVVGASVRYRRRVRALDRLVLRSAMIGRDARFLYFHHALWRGAEATSAALVRAAVTGPSGILDPGAMLAALGTPDWNPPLPGWVEAWIAAEAERPWPPVP
jgi:acyl-CoA thioesterase FadM